MPGRAPVPTFRPVGMRILKALIDLLCIIAIALFIGLVVVPWGIKQWLNL